MRRKAFILSLFLFVSATLIAQLEDYEFEYPYLEYTANVTYDDKGFIWYPDYEETDYYRYNGNDSQPLGLPELLANSNDDYIIENPLFFHGRLMLNSRSKVSLLDINTKEIQEIWKTPADHRIDIVYIDETEGMWVFTTDTTKNSRPVYYAENVPDLTLAFDLHPYFGDEQQNWWYELSDANGLLYFYKIHGDLLILNKKGEEQKLHLIDQKDYDEKYECSVFRLDNRNNLWRSYRKDVEIYDPEKGVFTKHPLSGMAEVKSDCPENYMRGLRNKKIWIDSQDRHWFAGENTFLLMYDPKTKESTYFGRRLINDIGGKGGAVNNLIEDHEGNMYGTKRGGLFKISKKNTRYESYLMDTKNPDHPIYKTQEFINAPIDPTRGEETITNTTLKYSGEDLNGDLYFTSELFVFKLDMGTKKIRIVPFHHELYNIGMSVHNNTKILSIWGHTFRGDENDNFVPLPIYSKSLRNILIKENGDVWYTGFSKPDSLVAGHVYFLTRADSKLENAKNFTDPAGVVDFETLSINNMVEDDDANIWLGTNDGLVYISSDGTEVERKYNTYSWNEKEVAIDQSSELQVQWLGADKLGFYNASQIGVLNTVTNQLEYLATKDELNIKNLRSSFFPSDTTVWVGQLDRLSYHDFTSKETIHFAHELGLHKVGRVAGINPIRNSKLVLSTENGLYIFNPQKLLSRHEERAIKDRNTAIQLTNYSYMEGSSDSLITHNYFSDQKSGLTFDHNDKMLSLEFSLMNFTKQSEHTFSYCLEGFEKNWTVPEKSNTLNYTNLPSGKYNLKVRAHNGNGIWTESILKMPIRIKTAWYKSWWFLALCLLMAAVTSYVLFKRYLYLAKNKIESAAQVKEAERLRELDKLKNLFFTNITHEFRTPLTVINGVNESSASTTKEKIMIRRNSNNLLHLINQILDLSKLESKKLTLHLTQSDIVAFLKYLTSSFESLAEDRGVQLEFNSDIGEVLMNYDEMRVQQIIYNLLSNALKSTGQGGLVALNLTKEENENLVIIVSDTGHGISQEDIPFLFDHFYQVSNSSTNPGEGSGVGLSLTKELVRIMGGEISLTSELGVGTHFSVVLPIRTEVLPELIPSTWDDGQNALAPVLSETIRSTELVKTETQYPSDTNKPILLIIEDNLDIISYISNLLHKLYRIVVSVNGALGIQKAKEIIPDIIISDVMMPIKTGFEVCETLKQDIATDHIPIILLTARATFEDRIQGLKYGADAYINKPFAKEELLTRLEQLIMVRTKIQERYSKQVILPITEEPTQEDAFYLKLQKAVVDNLSDVGFGVPELAHEMLMSQTQVFRKTKAVVNKTPALFIRSIRLEKAKELLSDTSLTITEIAKKTGFRDPSYFARTFSKEFNTSPSDFRK